MPPHPVYRIQCPEPLILEPSPARKADVYRNPVALSPQKPKKVVKEHAHEVQHWHFDGMSKRLKKEYAPTKVKPSKLPRFEHLHKHAINQCIEKSNHLIMMLFKQKMKPTEDVLIPLFKFFNIPIPRGNGTYFDFGELKKPEFISSVNLRIV